MDLTIINHSNQRLLIKDDKMPYKFLPFFIEPNSTFSLNYTHKWSLKVNITGNTELGYITESISTNILVYNEGDEGSFDNLYCKHNFTPYFNPVPDLAPDNNVTFFDTLVIKES